MIDQQKQSADNVNTNIMSIARMYGKRKPTLFEMLPNDRYELGARRAARKRAGIARTDKGKYSQVFGSASSSESRTARGMFAVSPKFASASANNQKSGLISDLEVGKKSTCRHEHSTRNYRRAELGAELPVSTPTTPRGRSSLLVVG